MSRWSWGRAGRGPQHREVLLPCPPEGEASAAILATVPRLRRQDILVSWRVSLLAPGAVPVAAALTVLTIAAIALASYLVPPLGALLGAIDREGYAKLAEDRLGIGLHQRQRLVRLFLQPLGQHSIGFTDAAIRIVHFVERRCVAHYAPQW